MAVMTVSICVNGRPVYARSVVNRLAEIGRYVCDDGSLIDHDPDDGAVELAVKALRTIREVKATSRCGTVGVMSGSDRPGKRTSIYLRPELADRVAADGRTLPELIEAGLGSVPPLNFVLDQPMLAVLLGGRLDEARLAEAVASAGMAVRGDTRTGPHVETTARGLTEAGMPAESALAFVAGGAVADQAGDVKSLGGRGTEGSARPRRKPGPAAATAPRGARSPAPPSKS